MLALVAMKGSFVSVLPSLKYILMIFICFVCINLPIFSFVFVLKCLYAYCSGFV